MNFRLADSFAIALNNLRVHLWNNLLLSDEFLDELVQQRIITNENRHRIFSTPRCPNFSNLIRVILLINILHGNWEFPRFIKFLRTKGNIFIEILLYLDTEISNNDHLSEYINSEAFVNL